MLKVMIRISDPEAVSWEEVDGAVGCFTMNRPGKVTIEIAYRWNPSVLITKEIIIAGGNVPPGTEKPDDINGY